MKKDKKQIKESIIGRIIYGFLMFSPLLAILVTTLYVVINPNAKESYYGENINDTIYENIQSYSDLQTNGKYRFTLAANEVTNVSNSYIYFNNAQIIETSISNANDLLLYDRFNVTWADNRIYIAFSGNNLNALTLASTSGYLVFDFYLTNYSIGNNSSITFEQKYDHLIQQVTYNKYSYLDNAFYYGLDSVENSSYFGWSKNTAIYSVLNTTCNGIGITTTFVPMILTYWLIISVIYLIYDLVLVFIHIAHKKVHELEEF